jgi:hypothetical protein
MSDKGSRESLRKWEVSYPKAGRYILGLARPRQYCRDDHN